LSLGWAWVYLMNPAKVEMLKGVHLPDGWWSSDNKSHHQTADYALGD
jgi:gamma-glutamylcyclotransferase (GGCT)/AIG2-like uncharacterized protein YtfP